MSQSPAELEVKKITQLVPTRCDWFQSSAFVRNSYNLIFRIKRSESSQGGIGTPCASDYNTHPYSVLSLNLSSCYISLSIVTVPTRDIMMKLPLACWSPVVSLGISPFLSSSKALSKLISCNVMSLSSSSLTAGARKIVNLATIQFAAQFSYEFMAILSQIPIFIE